MKDEPGGPENEDELIPYPDSVTMHQGRNAVGLRHTGTDIWIIPLRPRRRGCPWRRRCDDQV